MKEQPKDYQKQFDDECSGWVLKRRIGYEGELYLYNGEPPVKKGRTLTLIGAIKKCERFHARIENDIAGWEIWE